MTGVVSRGTEFPLSAPSRAISSDWLDVDMSLYLDRCQIDTPERLIMETWNRVAERRPRIGLVYDFGAGDGRFARHGEYRRYVGYEIDMARCKGGLGPSVEFVHRCAFADASSAADLCIGNPPFVRNQDLPTGWRNRVADRLEARTGIRLSGLANAWQYFFLLSLISAKDNGLCALVVPYEWVSRPSSKALRDYIIAKGWEVDVYRLEDASFESVLTTSSITIVDKKARTGQWRFFQEEEKGAFRQLPTVSESTDGHLPYVRPIDTAGPRATRGLSPGSQRVFTLTEAERARCGLEVNKDVVACITSLRPMPGDRQVLDVDAFNRFYRNVGGKCWLLRTDLAPSRKLSAYLASVPESERATATCAGREPWWQFVMPLIPDMLVATSFTGARPKMVTNVARVRPVGGVAAIHDLPVAHHARFVAELDRKSIADRIVSHAKGLRKIEIHQLNGLIGEVFRT